MTVFKRYSAVYDLLYKDKDYEKEALHIAETLQKYGIKKGSSILNLGCGTGKHDHILAKMGYKMTGVDMSQEMVAIANHPLVKGGLKDSNPLNPLSQGDLDYTPLSKGVSLELVEMAGGIKKAGGICSPLSKGVGGIKGAMWDCHFLQGDIRNIILEESFDAVTSMFHVMSYQNTNDDVEAVFKTAYDHLERGGVFLFDCWYGPAVLSEKPEMRERIVENDEIKVIRKAIPELKEKEKIVVVNYDFEVFDKSTVKTDKFSETHSMRYFFVPEIEIFCKNGGFEFISIQNKGWNMEVVLKRW